MQRLVITFLLLAQTAAVFTMVAQTKKLTAAQQREANAFVCGRIEGILIVLDEFKKLAPVTETESLATTRKMWDAMKCDGIRKLVDSTPKK